MFAPAEQSTQLIVGATPEDDRKILTLSDNLYSHFDFKRIYYSAYIPVNPAVTGTRPHLLREHRLYQADWLMRLYGVACDEILPADAPFLDEQLDPKTARALRHPERFPLDVNRAADEELLRIPGGGFRSAQRMVISRRIAALRMPRASVRQILMAAGSKKRIAPNQLELNLTE